MEDGEKNCRYSVAFAIITKGKVMEDGEKCRCCFVRITMGKVMEERKNVTTVVLARITKGKVMEKEKKEKRKRSLLLCWQELQWERRWRMEINVATVALARITEEIKSDGG